jgi:predicted nucleic acid-binding protein
MARRAVLLDTSFFLRFLNDSDTLFKHADDYFRYFIEKEITMMISTISIAEYCVGGSASELPLKNLQILPFNFKHAERAGAFARIVFQHKNKLKLSERTIIPKTIQNFLHRQTAKARLSFTSHQTAKAKRFTTC